MSAQPYYQLVDQAIRTLGVDPELCRGDKPGQWNMQRGSASVWIDMFDIEGQGGYFQCMAPVSAVPQSNKEAFYTEVLELNHKLYGVGLTKYKDYVYIKAIRELEGLDVNEILATLRRVGTYADDYDDYFKNKYFPA